MEFIYHGEVSVFQESLTSFLRTAQILRVKGKGKLIGILPLYMKCYYIYVAMHCSFALTLFAFEIQV